MTKRQDSYGVGDKVEALSRTVKRACRECSKEATPAAGGCTNGKCAACHKRCVHVETPL